MAQAFIYDHTHQDNELVEVGHLDRVELMSDKIKAVEVRAEIRQIRTMADGTVNVIINLPEDCMEQVKVLLDWRGLEVKAVLAC